LLRADEYVWCKGRGFELQYKGTPFEFLEKNPQFTGQTNELNYLGVVVYSALQKTFFSGYPYHCRKRLFGGWRRLLVWYLTKIHTHTKVSTFQFKMQVKKNITKYVVLCNIPRNM
jgi:hypothetical protein